MGSTTPLVKPLDLPMPDSSTSRSRSRARRRDTADSEKTGGRWARTVDDPWWPCLLALDGGGIRGYSSLLILKELMHRVYIWEVRLREEASVLQAEEHRRGRPPSRLTESSPGHSSSQASSGASEIVEPLEHIIEQTNAQVFEEAAVPAEDELLPCHYFDFMFGTSTGGLIATMLGRLRMSVPECLDLYRQVGEDLFGRRRSSVPLVTKYHHEPLEKAVQGIVRDHCRVHPPPCDGISCLHPWPQEIQRQVAEALSPSGEGQPFDVDLPRICHSCCLTAVHNERPYAAYMLRTYSHYYTTDALAKVIQYNEGADPLKIWEVTRATSAAPFYFKMLEASVAGELKVFKDGGIRENNPAGAALNEFNSLYLGKTEDPALLLSVGTGRPDTAQDGFASVWPGPFGKTKLVRNLMENFAILRNVLIKYTDGEALHEHIRGFVAKGENTWYKRLNVDDGLQDMPLDDWSKGDWHGQHNVPGGKSLTRMEAATEKYLHRLFDDGLDSYAEPSIMIDQTAEKLVRQRRAREQLGGDRWDTFVGKHLPYEPAKPSASTS